MERKTATDEVYPLRTRIMASYMIFMTMSKRDARWHATLVGTGMECQFQGYMMLADKTVGKATPVSKSNDVTSGSGSNIITRDHTSCGLPPLRRCTACIVGSPNYAQCVKTLAPSGGTTGGHPSAPEEQGEIDPKNEGGLTRGHFQGHHARFSSGRMSSQPSVPK